MQRRFRAKFRLVRTPSAFLGDREMREFDNRTEEQARLDDEIRAYKPKISDENGRPDFNKLPEHLKERMRERKRERLELAKIDGERAQREVEELWRRDPEQAQRNHDMARKMGLLEGPLGVVDYGAADKESDE